ncbi:MAG TPA: ComEC/Rec2 family competence protein [Terriglobales bacterium]|nr:ComEC/Rec2 family competence protein [Terriglobales bacterium]
MQPLFYAALAFALGIAAACFGPAAAAPALAPLSSGWAVIAAAAAAALLVRSSPAAARRPANALALALCLVAGYGRAGLALRRPPPPSALQQAVANLQPTPRTRLWLAGYLRDSPALLYDHGRASAVRLELEVAAVAPDSPAPALRPAAGGVRLYAYPPSSPAAARDDLTEAAPPPPASAAWAAPLLRLHAGQGLAASLHLRPLRTYHDPGVADFAAAARRQGIAFSATLPLHAWRAWPAWAAPPAVVLRARIWGWLSRRLDRLAPPTAQPRLNALLRGMLLGDVGRLDQATRANFQIDGVYHLLVVAGLHIGILAALLIGAFRRLRLPRLPADLLALALLAAYAWIIAGRTPTLRALLMLALYCGARWFYRERQALNAVGAAAMVLLAWRPLDLFASGFQMSLGAATLLAGVALPLLALTSQPLRRATRHLDDPAMDETFPPQLAQLRLDLRALASRLALIARPLGWRLLPATLRALLRLFEIAAISLILQLGFAPFNVVYFHRANPWSVVANALLVPAAAVLIPLAWLGLAATAAGAAATHAASLLLTSLGHLLLATADALARWPGAALRVPSPPGWFLFVFGAGAAAWLLAWRLPAPRRYSEAGLPIPSRRACLATSLAMLALAAVLDLDPFPARLPPGLTATVLDVGQGDSILVTFPDRRTLLVDGGPHSPHWDTGQEVVAPFLWSLGLRRLDAVLLTHAHNDHLGGLDTVVADFRPGEVWLTRTLPQGQPIRDFLRAAQAVGARLRRLDAGAVLLAGVSRLQVLAPPPSYQAGELASNDDSMVVRVSWGNDAMLLEGDAEAAGERWMLDHRLPLASALLKVGHHGSRTSSIQPFLAAVHPQVAVISVGAGNIYGLPSPAVVARLQQDGARLFRTDLDGAIQCRLQGNSLQVYLFRPLPGAE